MIIEPKKNIDLFGAFSLIGFSALLGLNHVIIKIVNEGLHPIFFCGLRSLIAIFFVLLWMLIRKTPLKMHKSNIKNGILVGLAFSLQFLCLFIALDYTSVIRTSIIYYSMPIWLTIIAHFFIPDDKFTFLKLIGLIISFLGIIFIFSSTEKSNMTVTIIGDFFALGGAVGWALIIFLAKGTNFSKERPEIQLLSMLIVSAPILLIISFFFGPIIRDFQIIHIFGILFQSIIIVAASFIFWLWLLSIYPASSVASFAFLTPLFGIFFGWFLLNESLDLNILISSVMVSLGITLINKKKSS